MVLFILSYAPQELIAQGASFQTTDSENGFTINYPTNWSLEKNYGIVTLSPPDAATVYRSSSGPYSLSIKEGVMVFPPEHTDVTLQEFAKTFSLLNSTYISNVSINEFSTNKFFLSGHPALRAIYSGKVQQTQTEAKVL